MWVREGRVLALVHPSGVSVNIEVVDAAVLLYYLNGRMQVPGHWVQAPGRGRSRRLPDTRTISCFAMAFDVLLLEGK